MRANANRCDRNNSVIGATSVRFARFSENLPPDAQLRAPVGVATTAIIRHV